MREIQVKIPDYLLVGIYKSQEEDDRDYDDLSLPISLKESANIKGESTLWRKVDSGKVPLIVRLR